jgi:hypothetical protein
MKISLETGPIKESCNAVRHVLHCFSLTLERNCFAHLIPRRVTFHDIFFGCSVGSVGVAGVFFLPRVSL